MNVPSVPPAPIFLAGPTAVGKSAVALALAERLGGEIISVDSMQVYRGLDIGTAKPTPKERQRVPHHLIDVAELTESFDAARFVSLAGEAAREINSRQHMPIFCGGTGLYFKAHLHGLGDAPPRDLELRQQLEQIPLPDLLHELEQHDPDTFASIDRQNPRRVVRAIEIIRLTGKPLAAVRPNWSAPTTLPNQPPVFVLRREPADMLARMAERVDQMFARGLVEETRQLLEHGLAGNETAMQAIGYRQVVAHLQGDLSLEETIELVKRRTRQFARRQMTWFRHQLACEWLDVAPADSLEDIATQVLLRRRAHSLARST